MVIRRSDHCWLLHDRGLFACKVIKNKMEVISKQKIHSDVVFKQGCRPELENLRVKRKYLKIWGYHGNNKSVKLH